VGGISIHAQLGAQRFEVGITGHFEVGYQTLFMPISDAAVSAACVRKSCPYWRGWRRRSVSVSPQRSGEGRPAAWFGSSVNGEYASRFSRCPWRDRNAILDRGNVFHQFFRSCADARRRPPFSVTAWRYRRGCTGIARPSASHRAPAVFLRIAADIQDC
jgi:hypothetical protein